MAMRASAAQIVDLEAYRRARSNTLRDKAAPVPAIAALPFVWYPVWMMIPVVIIQ